MRRISYRKPRTYFEKTSKQNIKTSYKELMKKISLNEEFILDGGAVFAFNKNESGAIVLKRIRATWEHSKPKEKKQFTPPTLQEAIDYFKSNGFTEEGAKKAWNHYELGNPPWHDTNGNPVRSWKQKFNTNWFRNEFKIIKEESKLKFFQ